MQKNLPANIAYPYNTFVISTIIFDLSEVYINGMYGIEEKIAGSTGQFVKNDYIHSLDVTKDFFNGKISEDEFWDKLIISHKWNINSLTLKKMIREKMTEIDGTRKIIEKLKDKGYKLGLLSVHAKEWIDHLEAEFDFHKLFDSRLYSFEIGLGKPDPRAFTQILEKLGVSPKECLFIDDYDVNTQAAEVLGISTIIFENAEQLEQELKRMEIL